MIAIKYVDVVLTHEIDGLLSMMRNTTIYITIELTFAGIFMPNNINSITIIITLKAIYLSKNIKYHSKVGI